MKGTPAVCLSFTVLTQPVATMMTPANTAKSLVFICSNPTTTTAAVKL
jgi:hypothetical protein